MIRGLQVPRQVPDILATAISQIDRNLITIRGYPLEEISGRVSYVDAIILCLRGELPGEVESTCVNAIFTAAMDHQFLNATALAARVVVSANPDPVAGIAAGRAVVRQVTAGVPSLRRRTDRRDFAEPPTRRDLDGSRRAARRRLPRPRRAHPRLRPSAARHASARTTRSGPSCCTTGSRSSGLPVDGKIGFYEAAPHEFLGRSSGRSRSTSTASWARCSPSSATAARGPGAGPVHDAARASSPTWSRRSRDGVPLRIVPESRVRRRRPSALALSPSNGEHGIAIRRGTPVRAAASSPPSTGRTSRSATSSRRRGAARITDAHVLAFSGVTGDFQHLHVDELYAEASQFGGRIAHGPLTAVTGPRAAGLHAGVAQRDGVPGGAPRVPGCRSGSATRSSRRWSRGAAADQAPGPRHRALPQRPDQPGRRAGLRLALPDDDPPACGPRQRGLMDERQRPADLSPCCWPGRSPTTA